MGNYAFTSKPKADSHWIKRYVLYLIFYVTYFENRIRQDVLFFQCKNVMNSPLAYPYYTMSILCFVTIPPFNKTLNDQNSMLYITYYIIRHVSLFINLFFL